MIRLFRRPPAPLPNLLADFIDELAMAYTAAPGKVVNLLVAHADAEFRLDVMSIVGAAAPDAIDAATAGADATRRAVLALSPTARRVVRRGRMDEEVTS